MYVLAGYLSEKDESDILYLLLQRLLKEYLLHLLWLWYFQAEIPVRPQDSDWEVRTLSWIGPMRLGSLAAPGPWPGRTCGFPHSLLGIERP